ncbi:O-acyltransferase like protein-like isoform X1 [Tachypleus tridentatus]|uniref:O-acyltransferase like protein-like isoform X1 n=2 Tax=Tachypleus tridentatus TaxID=6853 RepID=UPI003FD14917
MLIPLLGSGPLWHEGIDHVVEGCRKNWWANMLFINNFLTTKNVCLNYTWYLPNDFQFHILSLLILVPLMRSTVRGLLITATLVLSSMVITGAITEFYDYPATRLYGLPTTDEVWEFCTRIYFKPYTHLGAYCVGAMVGCLLAKKQQIALSPFQQVLGWILSMAGLMLVLYGTYDWNRGQETSRAAVVFYAATHRTVWAVAIAWLTVTCVYGYGGLLNTFLSLKIFVVLDRVTYAAYLIHPLFQQVYHSRLRVHLSGDQYVGIYGYLGNLMVVYPSAFLFTLFFESPFLSLEKLLLTRFTERKGIQRFT